MKVCTIGGARPNFVKIAPILAELRHYPELESRLIHTGQHYDHRMSASFFEDLEIPAPDINLNVGAGPAALQTAETMRRLTLALAADRPDLLVVVGAVNSTLAGALGVAQMQFPVAALD